MAFSDELSYDVWYNRTLNDEPAVPSDLLSFVHIGSGGTVSYVGEKEGATWRQEIYQGRRVIRQKVLV